MKKTDPFSLVSTNSPPVRRSFDFFDFSNQSQKPLRKPFQFSILPGPVPKQSNPDIIANFPDFWFFSENQQRRNQLVSHQPLRHLLILHLHLYQQLNLEMPTQSIQRPRRRKKPSKKNVAGIDTCRSYVRLAKQPIFEKDTCQWMTSAKRRQLCPRKYVRRQ